MVTRSQLAPASPIPAGAGIGLRAPHYREVVEQTPGVAWLEAHSENYFGDGGSPLAYLEAIRERYPLSLHGVGLSLGSTDPINRHHLRRLKALVDRFQPALVSDHLSWSSVDGVYLNDLLPLPYTEEALDHFVNRVQEVQQFLGRQVLVENPSSYLRYAHSTIPEWEFLVEVARRSGCALLLDVNNVHVSAVNHQFSAERYLEAVPRDLVAELHLAGHTERWSNGRRILIDDHGCRVAEPVWALYRLTAERFPDAPTLIEWDCNLPALEVLLEEADTADRIHREVCHADAA